MFGKLTTSQRNVLYRVLSAAIRDEGDGPLWKETTVDGEVEFVGDEKQIEIAKAMIRAL